MWYLMHDVGAWLDHAGLEKTPFNDERWPLNKEVCLLMIHSTFEDRHVFRWLHHPSWGFTITWARFWGHLSFFTFEVTLAVALMTYQSYIIDFMFLGDLSPIGGEKKVSLVNREALTSLWIMALGRHTSLGLCYFFSSSLWRTSWGTLTRDFSMCI